MSRAPHPDAIPRVFISYSSGDIEVAEKVKKTLGDRGTNCWLAPKDLRAGDDYAERIEASLQQCSVFVLLWSVGAANSDHVKREIHIAVEAKLKIVPVRLDATPIVKYFLTPLHWVRFADEGLQGIADCVAEYLRLDDLEYPLRGLYQDLLRHPDDVARHLEAVRLVVRFILLVHIAAYLRVGRDERDPDLNRRVEDALDATSLFVDFDVSKRLVTYFADRKRPLHEAFHEFFQLRVHPVPIPEDFESSDDAADAFDRNHLYTLCGGQKPDAFRSPRNAEVDPPLCLTVREYLRAVLSQGWATTCSIHRVVKTAAGPVRRVRIAQPLPYAALSPAEAAHTRLDVILGDTAVDVSPFVTLVPAGAPERWDVGILWQHRDTAQYSPLALGQKVACKRRIVDLPWGRLHVRRRLPERTFIGETHRVILCACNDSAGPVELEPIVEQLPENVETPTGARTVTVSGPLRLERGETRDLAYDVKGIGMPGTIRPFPADAAVAYAFGTETHRVGIGGDRDVLVQTIGHAELSIRRRLIDDGGMAITDLKVPLGGEYLVETAVVSRGRALPAVRLEEDATGAFVLDSGVVWDGPIGRVGEQEAIRHVYRIRVRGPGGLCITAKVSPLDVAVDDEPLQVAIENRPPPRLAVRWRAAVRTANRELRAEVVVSSTGGTAAYDVRVDCSPPNATRVSVSPTGSLDRLPAGEEAVVAIRVELPPVPAGNVTFRFLYRSVDEELHEVTAVLPLDRLLEANVASLPAIGREEARAALRAAVLDTGGPLIGVCGEHGVGRARLVRGEIEHLRLEGARIAFFEVECDAARGLASAVASLLESIIADGREDAERSSRSEIVAFLASIGMDETGYRGPVEMIVNLIQRSVDLTEGGCWAVAKALTRFTETRGVDRLVLLMRGISEFTSQELKIVGTLQAELRKTAAVRIIVTADEPPSSLGLDTRDVRFDRFSDADCSVVIDRVFILPRASEPLRRALIERSERIPANLFSLLRRLVDDQEHLLEFHSHLGVDTRAPETLADLPSTFQDAEARAAALSGIPPLLLAAFSTMEQPIEEPMLQEIVRRLDSGLTPQAITGAIQTAQTRQWLRPAGVRAFIPTSNAVRRALGQAAGRTEMERLHETLFAIGEGPIDHLVGCRTEFLVQQGEHLTAGLRQLLAKGRFGQVRRLVGRLSEVRAALPMSCQVEVAVLEQELRWEQFGDFDRDACAPLAARIASVPGATDLRARLVLIASRWHARRGEFREAVAAAEGAFRGVWPFRRLRVDDPALEFEFQLQLWASYYRTRDERSFRAVDSWLWQRVTEKREGAYDCRAIARFLRVFLDFHHEMPDPEARREHFALGSVAMFGTAPRAIRDSEIEILTRMQRLHDSELQQFLEHPERLNLDNGLLFGRLCVDVGVLVAQQPVSPDRDQKVDHYLDLALALFKESGFRYDHAVACRTRADVCLARLEAAERDGTRDDTGARYDEPSRWLNRAAEEFQTLHADAGWREAVTARAALVERWVRHDPMRGSLLIDAYEVLLDSAPASTPSDERELMQCRLVELYAAEGRLAEASRILDDIHETSPHLARYRALIHAESIARNLLVVTDDCVGELEDDLVALVPSTAGDPSPVPDPADHEATGAFVILTWALVEFHRAGERGAKGLALLRVASGAAARSQWLSARLRNDGCECLFDLWRMVAPTDEEMIRDFSTLLLPIMQPNDVPGIERLLEGVWSWEASRDDGPHLLAAADMTLALCETLLQHGAPPAAALGMGTRALARLLDKKTRKGTAVARLLARALAVLLRCGVPGQGERSFLAEVTRVSDALEETDHAETALHMLIHLIEVSLDIHRHTHNQWYYDEIIQKLAPRLGPLRAGGEQELETITHLINLYLQLPNGLTDAVDLMEEHCKRLLEAGNYGQLPRYLSFLSDLFGRESLQSLQELQTLQRRWEAGTEGQQPNSSELDPLAPFRREARIRTVATQLCLDIINDLTSRSADRSVQRSVLYDTAKLLLRERGTADLCAAVYVKLFDLSEDVSGGCVWGAYTAWTDGNAEQKLSLEDRIALTSFSNMREEHDDGRFRTEPRNYLINAKHRNQLLHDLVTQRPDDAALVQAHALLEVHRLSFLMFCARNVHEFPSHPDEFERLAWVTFLQDYLFTDSDGAPMWQQLQRISAHAAVIEQQLRRATADLSQLASASDLAQTEQSNHWSVGADGALQAPQSAERFIESSSGAVRALLLRFRRRGRRIMEHLTARVRSVALEDIMTEVCRRLKGKPRSINFGEILGLWEADEDETARERKSRQPVGAFLDRDPRDLVVPVSRGALNLLSAGEVEAAERMYRFALDLCDRGTEPAPELPRVLHGLAGSLRAQRKLAEARDVLLREVAVRDGRNDDDLITALRMLAEVYEEDGDFDSAVPHLRRKLAIDEARLGAASIQFALAKNQAGIMFRTAGRAGEAEELFHSALAIDRAGQPAESPVVPHRLYNLSTVLVVQGKFEEARAAIDEAYRSKNGVRDVTTARLLFMKVCLQQVGELPEGGYVAELHRVLLADTPLPVPGNLTLVADFTPILRWCRMRVTGPDAAFLEALAEAVNDCDRVSALNDFEQWTRCSGDHNGSVPAVQFTSSSGIGGSEHQDVSPTLAASDVAGNGVIPAATTAPPDTSARRS